MHSFDLEVEQRVFLVKSISNPLSGENSHKKCSASIDAMHQVVSLHIGVERWTNRHSAGIVHQNIDTAKLQAKFKGQSFSYVFGKIGVGPVYYPSISLLFTLSTAAFTTDFTCCSSRTSRMHGNAFPPAASTIKHQEKPWKWQKQTTMTICVLNVFIA